MKKQIKLMLIVLCLMTLLLSVGVLASCKDDEQPGTITITVNANIDGVANQTFTADKNSELLSLLASYVPQNANGWTFVGWYDANNSPITDQTRWEQDGTVTAQWDAYYITEYYLQTDDGYVKSNEHTATKTARVGTTVVADRADIEGYQFDAANSLNVTSATLGANTTLKMYYKRAICTITYIANNPDATGAMGQQTVPYGVATKLMAVGFKWNNEDRSDFGGWNTQANCLGDVYTDECEVTLTGNLTLYAQWKITYNEEIWVEQFDGSDYVYVLYKTATQDGILGASMPIQTALRDEDYATIGHNHYYLDEAHEGSATGSTSLQSGEVLKAYYSLERFYIFYADDQVTDTVRYGQSYTVRTPEQDAESGLEVITYSSSPSGDGREYKFGSQIQSVTSSLKLYSIYADMFTDKDGSGDRVVIRSKVTGLGSAILIKNSGTHLGFVEISDTIITFTVVVGETELHGKLLSDGTFVYRNEEEVGVYLIGNALFPEAGVSFDKMLALDGYGTGTFAYAVNDGTGLVANHYVSYIAIEDGDYYMEYYLPANPDDIYYDYFKLVRTEISGVDDMENIVGYFLICGSEYGIHSLVYNGSIVNDSALLLDGYGNAYYSVDGFDTEIEGTYLASEDYTQAAPEYIFIPIDTSLDSFYFIIFAETNPNTNQSELFFMQKHDEEGAYTQTAGVAYPELYLDGYGMCLYTDSERGDERLGTYALNVNDGVYEITVTFYDDIGGTMRVSLDRQNRTYAALGDFQIVDGVLVKYYGTDSVIVVPEGVTEIASDAFFDAATYTRHAITTLTLPSTLQKIGDYAFQNSANNDKSVLKTVYLNATTPPELGADPFRWVTSEFKIIVPDGCEEAYRNDAGWTHQYPSATYANYVTSLAEIADKPVYEIKDGVLLSYNNKDENPSNVAIVIPDEVTEIADYVFEGRSYIVSVDLNNVTVIGEGAFDSCEGITSVTFNSNTESIGDYAFFSCLGLTEVELGNVQAIGEAAFAMCTNLTKVNIGSGIEEIGTNAFALCAVELDEVTGETAVQNELILTIAETATAPEMGTTVFKGSVPRIYVASYDVGVKFARNPSWALYATSMRVKSTTTQTLYSVANVGAQLVLGDNALYDNTLSGLYKWDTENNELHVAWFERGMFDNSTTLTILEQIAEYDEVNQWYHRLSYNEKPIVLVTEGSEITYAYADANETLTIIFGDNTATFNGNAVTIDIVNYRTQFSYNGYVYHLELANDKTFYYIRKKIQTTETYTAADGSTLTVTFGDSIKAVGTIVTGDGSDVFPRTTEVGWYLTAETDGTYTWTIPWRNDKYKVTATFNEDGTFTYFVGEEATSVTYHNDQDHVVVTTNADGKIDMLFSFKTANGELNQKCVNVQAVEGASNTYLVTIEIMVEVLDDNGDVIDEVPSEFNGTYHVTLNSTYTYVLTAVE